jgi:transcriptional regulator with XRE-family HTH domain
MIHTRMVGPSRYPTQYQNGAVGIPDWSGTIRAMQDPALVDDANTAILARIARNMRWVREIVSPSAAQTARDLGLLNANQWTRYETGARKPDHALLTRFCNLYGCTLDFLYRNKLDNLDEDLKLRLVASHPELVLSSQSEDT